MIERCFRLENRKDPVPHVPVGITGWAHVGLEIEVNGKVEGPHSLDAYLAGLNNLGEPLEVDPVHGGPEAVYFGGPLAAPTL